MIGQSLLVLHIAAGSIALLTAALALATAKGGANHVRVGRVYAISMTVIFLTAVPLAMFGTDIFLLLIAVFSFYLVFAGWRFARNRRGHPQPVDWAAVVIMGLTGLGMWGYGAVLGTQGDAQWVTMVVFGTLAGALALADGQFYRLMTGGRSRAGKMRIQRHLSNMLAGTIATVTAVLVVNVDFNPVWVPWILPTVVMTPLITWWNIRIAKGSRVPART